MLGGAVDMEYTVNIAWDEEANVWLATSEDIPGLVLESGSYDALIERLKIAIPEILEANHLPSVSILNYSPISNRNVTVDTKIKSRHTANAILKQAGIDYKF